MASSNGTGSELERRDRQQQLVADLSDLALSEAPLEELFERATDAIAETLSVDSCVALESRSEGRFHVQGVSGTIDEDTTSTVVISEPNTRVRQALTVDAPVVVEDVRTDERVTDLDRGYERNVQSGISVVVGPDDDPWGVLDVRNEAYAEYTDADVTFVGIVANVLASAVERERANQRHHEEMELTDEIVETTPIGITLVDSEGTYVFANERAEELLGRPIEEVRSYTHDDDRWNLVDESGDPLASEELPFSIVKESQEPVYGEVIGVDQPDGTRVWLSTHCRPLFDTDGSFDGAVYALQDITERKRLETRLEEILGRIDDAVCAFDEEFRYTHVNERAEELLQRSESELLGEQLWEQFPEAANQEIVRESFETAMGTQEPTSYVHYFDLAERWLEVTIYPSETGASVYFRDVTERKEYRRRLEESNERLEQFAYAASHDLQEPLRMVSSYLRLIEDRYGDELDEDGEEFIAYAVDGAERMREMIDGLLAFSRVETSGRPFEPVDLNDVLADVRRDLRFQIEESDAEITSESLPRVRGDGNQLRQVFQNLLSNAIEYTDDEPPAVDVSAKRDGDKWILSVSDDGIGIDPADTDRIFGVFERLHSVDERSGSGIGLALCERIVERHGGDIWVESEPGEGSTFSFSLPAHPESTVTRSA
ncbi:ATP-binding protein [Natrialba sp. INN-245]|uniref:GAF domain-containing sensor histidine kinase n=1 Tax=Natrialba sp. INN-245 TaxID=2690967 RepID=UPI0013109359|nr:ATP-binding protein [Natrialba sp. INN-245]MWV39107.1 PAS domain-containing protein [Natrialba sp. INN-245]